MNTTRIFGSRPAQGGLRLKSHTDRSYFTSPSTGGFYLRKPMSRHIGTPPAETSREMLFRKPSATRSPHWPVPGQQFVVVGQAQADHDLRCDQATAESVPALPGPVNRLHSRRVALRGGRCQEGRGWGTPRGQRRPAARHPSQPHKAIQSVVRTRRAWASRHHGIGTTARISRSAAFAPASNVARHQGNRSFASPDSSALVRRQ